MNMSVCYTALSSDEEALVIEILLASVRQTAEGPPLAGRSMGKKVSFCFPSSSLSSLHSFSCEDIEEHT